MKSSDIWAITSYYNPNRYSRRTQNFRQFRENLPLPLIVVELSGDDTFEIPSDSNTIVLKVQSRSQLWHKETLLNCALSALPDDAEHIAWLDCDIVFQNPDWIAQAVAALQRYPLIQLFSDLSDLDRFGKVEHGSTGRSVLNQYLQGGPECLGTLLRPRTGAQVRQTAYGLAWAARTSLMRRYKFYDSMIVGGGDIALIGAAMGRHRDVVDTLQLSAGHACHFMSWAEPFYSAVRGEVGCIDGNLHHLWHGDVANRSYIHRHAILKNHNFNPVVDLVRDSNGIQSWKDTGSLQQQMVEHYFASRGESNHVEEGNWKASL